jgi:hypothetical protein
MRSVFRVFFTGLIAAFTVFAAPAYAADAITQTMVEEKNAALTRLLNDRKNPAGLTHYMHDHISDNARFVMTVSNPVMPQIGKDQNFELNKQDYINSYIQGPAFITGYSVKIETGNFRFDEAKGEAYSTDVIVERGTIASPRPDAKSGQDMISRTTCNTVHRMEAGKLLSAGGQCHTDVSFEEAI